MRSIAASLADHLMWTRTGQVWAFWEVTAPDYAHRPLEWKEYVRLLHQVLLRSVDGEAAVFSIVTPVDPADVTFDMRRGVDMERHPAWEAECRAAERQLAAARPLQRTHWLGVPLLPPTLRARVGLSLTAARDRMWDAAGLPRTSPGGIAEWMSAAHRIEQSIPAQFDPRHATPADLVRLHRHAQQRGLPHDVAALGRAARGRGSRRRLDGLQLPVAILDEGGRSDTDGRMGNPWARRYLKVVSADPSHEDMASYQAMLVLRSTPEDDLPFPGGEFLGRVDEAGSEADWVLRLVLRPGHEAARRNRRAVINLNDQYRQRENDAALGLRDIDLAARSVEALSSRLAADEQEIEVRASVVFVVSGTTPEETRRKARALAGFYAPAGYRLDQPIGEQSILWEATLPGASTTPRVRQWEQLSTSYDLSATIFLAREDLGDTRGSLLGLNISAGPDVAPLGAVLHDILGAAERDISGSVGVVGELGAGKSVVLKKLAGDVVARGGRVVAVDRTAMGEYETWARSLTDVEVVDVLAPERSLDPLRILPLEAGCRVLQSFLTPLLDVSPTSAWGVILNEVLQPVYLQRHGVTSAGGLVAHLRDGCEVPGALDLARVLDVYASRDIGRVLFDGSLPPMRADAPAVVVRTHELALPTTMELTHEHLYRQLRLEKRFGRAFYALVTAMARRFAFARADELVVLVVDEAHHVTSSPEAESEITTFVRDGRKHSAAVLLGSHDPEADFGSATLRGLIPTRILMRHRDEVLARRGLAWLDMDSHDDDLVKLVRFDTSPVGPDGVPEERRGEAFLRDSSGRVGRLRVTLPAQHRRAQAVLTTPTGLSAGDARLMPATLGARG